MPTSRRSHPGSWRYWIAEVKFSLYSTTHRQGDKVRRGQDVQLETKL
jgi:hypothetical protein